MTLLSIANVKIGSRINYYIHGKKTVATVTYYNSAIFDCKLYNGEVIQGIRFLASFSLAEETGCRLCQMINDPDVSVCWNCACLDPYKPE